ncbi:MAG TPA: dihydrolipoamide acetyltransferase family protein [Gemmatimonadales bacterium]|nr:dihydrolipoamide acetyltransferase family protein [Gemmatimonadales bacterium]
MATKVVMEALSPTMEEGRLVEWKKQLGDTVAVGDVLAEVETDKAVMELVARVAGTLIRQTVKEGATVPVASEVGLIGDMAEAEAAVNPPAQQATQPTPDRNRPVSMPPAPPAAAATEGGPVRTPALQAEGGQRATAPRQGAAAAPSAAGAAATGAARTNGPAPAPAAAPAAPGGRIKASPLARKIAAERGVDIGAVRGSGPEGRVIARDLEGAQAATAPAAPPTPAGAPGPAPARAPIPATGYTDQPLTQIRKTIAKRLVQSIGPIPTFYLTTEVDMERVAEARAAMLETDPSVKVSVNDIIIKAVATALRRHPACNAWWQDDHIRVWHDVHIGMAVAIEDGLITPVIRHADQKSLREIATEARDLAGRARERRLGPDEYTGATFSISNLGMLDIDEFTAVINPPEAAILAVGRMQERPVVHDGQVVVRRRMRMTMSCDHRVIDGATGAQFLKTLKAMLENPLAMVW